MYAMKATLLLLLEGNREAAEHHIRNQNLFFQPIIFWAKDQVLSFLFKRISINPNFWLVVYKDYISNLLK